MTNQNTISLTHSNHSGSGSVSIDLVFEKTGDRWAHRLVLLVEDREFPILESTEVSADPDWPSNAPLQEVSHHDLPDGEAILGVGMAGKSHWSASFSIDNNQIKSDLACLQKTISENASLASTYQTCKGTQIESIVFEDCQQIKLTHADAKGFSIILESIADSEMKTVFRLEDSILNIQPHEISKSPVQATRWGYRVKFSE